MTTINKTKFDKFRAAILAKREARDSIQCSLAVKYGQHNTTWFKASERAKAERAMVAYDKACDRMFALLDASPREWRSGVPAHWVSETLSYIDAVKPLSEPLSVVPPKAFGS